ncbi:MAG TPA: hypothetical protein VL495_07340 [Edaphobacter sp.]|jgi:hypothetical protein|nr:hypothetical protein [Edaphobacter sp.]
MKRLADFLLRKVAVLTAVVVIALAIGIGSWSRGSLRAAWNMIHIPANAQPFSDASSIPSAIEVVLIGLDPYRVNPVDPLHRLFNYPPIWLDLRYLGIRSQNSNLLGLLFAVAAVCGYLFLFNTRTFLTIAIVFLALISNGVLFGIERGNSDQFVFFLLVVGFFLLFRQRVEVRARWTSLLLVCLTVLKIYPFAAVTVFLQQRRGWLRASLTAVAAIAALVLTCGRRLPLVIANTPLDTDLSFGSFPFFSAIGSHFMHPLVPWIAKHHAAAPLAAILLGGTGLLVGALAGNRLQRILPPLNAGQVRGAIAIACLSIFCLAFVAGSSYDYRLIYLTGGLAWLIEDLDTGLSKRSLPAALLILLLLWKPFWLSITGELLDGAVFLMSSLWLGSALTFRSNVRDELSGAAFFQAAQKNTSLAPSAHETR